MKINVQTLTTGLRLILKLLLFVQNSKVAFKLSSPNYKKSVIIYSITQLEISTRMFKQFCCLQNNENGC